eukprot:scaffold1940_cov149-Amphora_coffeaeformis.AAC.4
MNRIESKKGTLTADIVFHSLAQIKASLLLLLSMLTRVAFEYLCVMMTRAAESFPFSFGGGGDEETQVGASQAPLLPYYGMGLALGLDQEISCQLGHKKRGKTNK